ncbi:MAG: asparagine synthase (glutamine-hydrolyzing) [Desulfobacter sp.]|nr:MAG: asparagine synthase (glutamine-hydrolyzing) [Desulfobacter sp.]
MCGISGIYFKGAEACGDRISGDALIRTLVESMDYRGPDHRGFYHDDRVCLGMSRLRIVDVQGGDQPLKNEDQSLVLVCNGEIYNHFDLRRQLEQKGHRFRTRSDAEVILHLYEEKGAAMLNELAGMFAFSLWDCKQNKMILARDRAGIKPLYLYRDSRRLVFSSEMSSLVNALKLCADLDPERIWEFCAYGFPVDNRQTVHRNIQRLCPGEALVISGDGEEVFSYWQPAYLESGPTGAVSMDEVEERYSRSIDRHFYTEVPLALMLSGGLDSASIAVLGQELGHRPQALTVGYDLDTPSDERAYASQTALICGLDLHEVVMDYEAYVKGFHDLMEHCDEPVADIAAIPQWKIFERARELGFKVLVNGLGGDEIFYGYGVWNEAVERFMDDTYSPFFDKDDVSGFFYHPAYRAARRFLDLCALPDFRESGTGCDALLAERFGGASLKGVDRIYHLLFKTWLPNNCLLLADRLSMAHSIELRVPMLDPDLVDYVQGLAPDARYVRPGGKKILKDLLKQRLPSSILDRPKQGFTPPGKYMKEMVFSCKESVFDNRLIRNLFDLDAMTPFWGDTAYLEVWFRLLVLGRWHDGLFERRG